MSKCSYLYRMKPAVFLILIFTFYSRLSAAQENDCNKLGAWIWYIEQTGFSHAELADTLSSLGVKRIYVKVADGIMDTVWWNTLVDKALIATYESRNMEVYGWSYNYPGSEFGQAEAVYKAAETGYHGYVVDVEHQFDGDSVNLYNLFTAFHSYKQLAVDNGVTDTTFILGCTTWGNPIDHWFRIDIVNPFVDAFFPQTYVELWGQYYLNNITFWIDSTNNEYRALGATKPIHHICATEWDIITAPQIDEFIAASGPETSLWRVPGGGTPLSIWNTWNTVNWHMNFCDTTVAIAAKNNPTAKIYPNPFRDQLTVETTLQERTARLTIYSATGKILFHKNRFSGRQILATETWPSGLYLIQIASEDNLSTAKAIKK
ncbi:MAG: T9SS type A sorting domain-containing protein [Bacteroidia bacterium]|nr:T9SS type A sorting domain-containing protein [Bacteroidia bacterium]